MRIAFVYDAVYPETKGGVERRVWELARLLVSEGHDVELLVPKFWDGADVIERDGVVLRGVSSAGSLYRSSGRRAVLPSLRHAWGAYRALRRRPYEIVDCQVPAHLACLSSRLASRSKKGTHQLVTWHEAWGTHWRREFGFAGYGGRVIERMVARLPVTHISVSNDTATWMRELRVEPEAVVEAGVDVRGIDSISASAASDIAFVGRLVPSKNLGLLLDAMAVLRDCDVEVTLNIVGDGPSREVWERRSRELGLGHEVAFLGSLPHWEAVIAVVKGSKVLALPSVREGFGLIALEAAACGTPVVTVDHPRNAARHLVDHGRTGLVVQETPEEMAKAIGTIIDDEDLRARMGEEARRMAGESGWDRTLADTMKVYARIGA
jgi:glycosyltransferase involved in cell wall biosynthesis